MRLKKIANNPYFFLLKSVAIVLLILLTAFNLEVYHRKTRVLGVSTQNLNLKDPEIATWLNFLNLHPTYFDGWRQLYFLTGNEDYLTKALQIKPNYGTRLSPLP